MSSAALLNYLAKHEAVLTGSHFVYTSGMHGTSYVNIRSVAHDAHWMAGVGQQLAERIMPYGVDLVLGPETLGRTLAAATGAWTANGQAIWCEMVEATEDTPQHASFSEKMKFYRLVGFRRVALVDDLLTSGRSLKLVTNLVNSLGGEVVVAAVVVRRTPDVTAEDCGAPALEVLADIEGFEVFTPEECAASGPCSQQVPVVLRPGHGHKWIKDHPDYPVAS